MNGTVIEKFLAVLKYQKILRNICFSEQIFYRKQSLGAPELSPLIDLVFSPSSTFNSSSFVLFVPDGA